MNARQKAEYERLNALPRAKSGMVAYYYKPQTKYPPRIYVFMQAELWQDRNRRPMGLHTAFPFLTRPMNGEEIEYHHFNERLCYHQYEDWGKLIYAEEKEAEQLDLENPGTGAAFLEKLKCFQDRYSLGSLVVQTPNKPEPVSESKEMRLVNDLLKNGHQYPVAEIGTMLDEEQQGLKRIPVLIVLRELYRSLANGNPEPLLITAQQVERKANLSALRTRQNLARRVIKQNRLFALEEIRQRYPNYTAAMLDSDLSVKGNKAVPKRKKPVLDYRRCQLAKLARRLKEDALDESQYYKTCCQIVILQQAHDLRLPIPKAVTFAKQTEVYSFHWKTRETVIKAFVEQANTAGMTHERLAIIHEQMTSSAYCF